MRIMCISLLIFFFWMSPAAAQRALVQVKAVFLFKFPDYVTWPPKNRPESGGIFNMCILGSNPFGNTLEVIASKQNKYSYNIQYYSNSDTPENCHLANS